MMFVLHSILLFLFAAAAAAAFVFCTVASFECRLRFASFLFYFIYFFLFDSVHREIHKNEISSAHIFRCLSHRTCVRGCFVSPSQFVSFFSKLKVCVRCFELFISL